MSDLFVFRCQKCSIGKLIIFAGGEYEILHRQFFDGNTLQNSFFIIFFLLFIKKVEGSEIVGLKIFCWSSQASMIFITYTLLKCLLKMFSKQDSAVDFIWWRPFYLQCQRTGVIIRLHFLAKHFAMKTYMP